MQQNQFFFLVLLQQGSSTRHHHQQPRHHQHESSPETESDFVMVPTSLAMDSAEAARKAAQARQMARQAAAQMNAGSRRHTVSGPHPGAVSPASVAVQQRPVHLPMVREPMPVPSQKDNYQQLQQSLMRYI